MHPSRLLVTIFAVALMIGASPARCIAADQDQRAAATEAMLRAESLGDLRLGLAEKSVLKLLGKPEKQGALTLQGADGAYVQDWHYPKVGLVLTMTAGEKKSGPKSVDRFTASAPCTLATKKGIQIGSPEADVKKAYGAHVDRDEPAAPGVLVAGSVYGGIIFNFSKGKVTRIFFGAAAE